MKAMAEFVVPRSMPTAQAVGTEQEWAVCRTAAHPHNEATNQGHVALPTDLTGEPQAGPDHHRQGHPHDVALRLDADLISLDVPEISGLLDQILLDGLPMPMAVFAACRPTTPSPMMTTFP
jgi:hypothetical protein